MKTFKFYGVDCNRYKLDDVVWEAIKDESGYRSYLGSIEISEKEDNSIFFSEPLDIVSVREFDDGSKKGFEIYSVEDNHVWVFIGTEYYDEYYPCFFRFCYTPKQAKLPKPKWEEWIK